MLVRQRAKLLPAKPLPGAQTAGGSHGQVEGMHLFLGRAQVVMVMRAGSAQRVAVHDDLYHHMVSAVQTGDETGHVFGKFGAVSMTGEVADAQGMVWPQADDRFVHVQYTDVQTAPQTYIFLPE